MHLSFDVVIIGSGGAGLMTALSCLESGVKNIAVISKAGVLNSHTVAAKGGINAALGNVDVDDWKWHAYDTIKGGDYLSDVKSLNVLFWLDSKFRVICVLYALK